ncbi:MAG: PLP-dependent aspartate aminotransferase family protein [Chloroflexota bacterium]|nr:PLP-dependent aspartate aminotransferase family protein [Chloroflexota bacterium]
MGDRMKTLRPASRAVHIGERPERPEFTPVVTPIYAGSSYIYEDMEILDAALGGTEGRYVYTRYGNPTTTALEAAIADLEGTNTAIAFSSGMAAVHAAIITSIEPSAAIVASQDLYGATYAMLDGYLRDWGCTVEFVDTLDLSAVEAVVARLQPALIVCEVVSNPLLRVTDVPRIVEIAKSARAAVLVDATFTTPVLYRPANDGVQIVVHSLTKYIAGHGDMTGGIVATSRMRHEKLANYIKMAGGVLGPFESWLALRGVKTLPLRMKAHCDNAATVAKGLLDHPRIANVNFPGLTSHPSHDTAARLFGERGFGGMISFDIKDAGREQAFAFLEALRMIVPATTLGDVYSLALYPAMSSHRAIAPERRAELGIGDGLIRLSVGIEDPQDILDDLDQALRRAT